MSAEPFLSKQRTPRSTHEVLNLPSYAPSLSNSSDGIGKAAWQLEDAMHDRLVEEYPSTGKARTLHLEVVKADNSFNRALKVLIFLTIFETPSWCSTDDFFAYLDPTDRCYLEDGAPTPMPTPAPTPGGDPPLQGILLSDLPYLPPGYVIVIEVIIIFVIARKLFLDMKLQNWYFAPIQQEYKNIKVVKFGLIMVVLHLMDVAFFLIVRPKWRLAFFPRTVYFTLLPQIQRLFGCITAVVNEFFSIAGFLVMTIVFFGWVTVTIFDDLSEEIYGKPVNHGLDSLGGTIYTMFVAGTTDDFVFCFIPSYTLYRPSGLLWFVFLVIVQVLLLNLVLDTLVAAYTEHSEKTEEDEIEDKTRGVTKAYKTLAEATQSGDSISKDAFKKFIVEFSKSPDVNDISDANADIIFEAVDEDKGGTIDRSEFLEICKVIQYEFWTTRNASPVKEHFPSIWNHKAMQKLIVWCDPEVGTLDKIMNYVLLVNLTMVVNESVYDVYGWTETNLMENLELIFSFIYVTEVGLVLTVQSFGQYWAKRSNQFDFMTTWLLLFSSVMDELASSDSGSNIKRYMNILRLLRLLRVIKQLKRLTAVQFMVATIGKLVSGSKDILSLLGIVVYFFATLSVQLWGGLLHDKNEKLDESEYKEKNFFVLNFNDFMMSVGVWWVSLLCEYVPAFPEAIAIVSEYPLTWLVFPTFYVTGVSIVFELVKAFTIEMFLALNKERRDDGGVAEEETFQCLETIKSKLMETDMELQYRAIGDLRMHAKMKEAMEEIEHHEKMHGEHAGGHHEHGGEHGHHD